MINFRGYVIPEDKFIRVKIVIRNTN